VRGGHLEVLAPSQRPGAPGCVITNRDPGVNSEVIRLPNWYLLLISGSVIASQRRSGVVRM
jgi:hypothetical protein